MAAMMNDIIQVPHSQHLKVFIQGNLDDRGGKTVFLTVHDVGENGRSFMEFVDSTYMAEVKKKTVWLHVILPGQDEEDDPLPPSYHYPSLDDIAKDLAVVLDAYNIKGTVMGFGEGAGANILLRFGLLFPNRCLGLVLLDCTASNAGFDEHVLCTMYNWKESGAKLWHKVIKTISREKLDKKPLTNTKLNSGNVGRYLEAYMKRDDVSMAIARGLSVDTVLICGSRSAYVQDAYYLNRLKSSRSTVLILDDKTNIISEAPKNLTRALILFCKGVGILTSVPLLGLEKEFRRIQEKYEMKEAELKMARTIRMYEDWVDFAP